MSTLHTNRSVQNLIRGLEADIEMLRESCAGIRRIIADMHPGTQKKKNLSQKQIDRLWEQLRREAAGS